MTRSLTATATSGVHKQCCQVQSKGRDIRCDSETPIVVAMDVTSSRGDDSKILYDKLPMYTLPCPHCGLRPSPTLTLLRVCEVLRAAAHAGLRRGMRTVLCSHRGRHRRGQGTVTTVTWVVPAPTLCGRLRSRPAISLRAAILTRGSRSSGWRRAVVAQAR